MTNYTKLLNGLDNLEMYLIKENLDTYIKLVNSGEKSVVDALYELVEIELAQKRIRAINGCIKVANFPFFKTLDDFDFGFQPGINKQELLDLASLRFIEQKENILFVGTSGVGKTHLATAIGMESAKTRFSTYFISFQSLMNQLKKALDENRLESRMKFFSRYKVLIIDEIGYLPIDPDAANLFFQLIARRYDKHCTIITTNSPFSKWGEIFGSPTLANAILDRLLHHSHVISIKGPSYRLREKQYVLEGDMSD
ncbi:MAG: ATP-binding protein [Clostridiales bacterium]|jgi:DNA replication protein DnaC|nr:ATP-binding protein [Clostridiales bacterium]